MPVWATTRATQDFAATTAAARTQVDSLVLELSPAVRLDQAFDGSAVLIQPRLQLAALAIGANVDYPKVISSWTVDGVDPGALRTGSLDVGADLEGCSRTFEQPVIASTGSRVTGDHTIGPLGYEITRQGPPPGPEVPISFNLDLLGTGALIGTSVKLPVLANGFVQRAPRKYDGTGHVMTLSGSGSWALYKDLEVDLELPANHGLTQGQVVVLLMQAAGVPAELIGIDPALGSPRSVAQKINCAGLQELCKDILRPIGHVPMPGRTDGVFRAVPLFPVETAVMTLTEVDISIDDGLEIDSDNTKPTCVVIEGRRLEDTGTGPTSGIVTVTVTVRTIDPSFVNPIAQSMQDSSGTITPTGAGTPAPVANAVTAETTVATTTENGCLILTHTTVSQYYDPPIARYIANTTSPDGLPRLYPVATVYFFDVTPSQDDATEGVQWIQPRFVIFSETLVEPSYNAALRRTGGTTKSNGWRNLSRSVKSRGTQAAPWDAQNYDSGFLSAAFDGLVFAAEHYFRGPGAPDNLLPSSEVGGISVTNRHLEVVTTVDEVDECDFVPSTETSTTAYGIRSGVLQRYSDGSESRDGNEVGVTSTETENRITSGDVTQSVRTSTDTEGRQLPGPAPTVIDGVPAAEICTVDEILKETEQRFTVEICIERDDGTQIRRKPQDLSSRWVETVAEAEFWGNLELDFLQGFPCALTMASPAPILDAGDTVALSFPEILPAIDKVVVLETETTIPPADSNEPVVHQLMVLIPPSD